MIKKNKRSPDQINKIRDHLKRMISFPLQTDESGQLSSDQLNIISTQPQRSGVTPPAMEQTFHIAKNKAALNRMNRPPSTEPVVENPDMFNRLKLNTTCKKVVSSNGRLCKVRRFNKTTLMQYLLEREETNSHHIKPDFSYGQLICLAILQSPEEKLILSQICEWISTSFPFFQLKDMNWQNCIRHTLSINPSFIKLESVKISKTVDKTKFIFINKDKPVPSRSGKNFRKSSRWGISPDGAASFFDYEDNGINLFTTTVKNINRYLPDGTNKFTFVPIYPQQQLQQQNPTLLSQPQQKNQKLLSQQPQQNYQFKPQPSPHDIKDGSNSSSPLSIMSNNSNATSNMSSTTDLSTMNNEKCANLLAPTIIISNSPSINDPKVKEDDEIIYDIDAKLDLLKTPKFDTSPIRKYFLNHIDTKLEGNINDHLVVNQLNHYNIPSPSHLKITSPTQLPINSFLNSYDDQNFVFHL